MQNESTEGRSLEYVYGGKYNGKRIATEQDVEAMCNIISKAKCVDDIPEINDDIYFMPAQLERICRTENPFVSKIGRLEMCWKKNSYDAFLIWDYLETGRVIKSL